MKYLKISTLDKGWQETDEMMLHAVMQLLVDYVEKQKPDQIIDWTSDDQHIYAWDVIQDTYDWWVNRRPKRVYPLDGIEVPRNYLPWGDDYPEIHAIVDESIKLDKENYQEDTDMILRIAEIRHMLWT